MMGVCPLGAPRSELFLTTKVWTEHLANDRVIPSLKDSLVKLRTDHVDLTLIHWPSPGQAVPLADTLGALMEAKAQGLTKQIGVSNFNIALLQESIEAVGAANIATHQIELSPYLQNRQVVDFARSQGLHITSYMTLAYAVIPSSTKRANLQSNLLAQQLRLTDENMAQIATLDRGERLANPEGLAPKWD